MTEAAFETLLCHRVRIKRPTVALDGVLSPADAEYVATTAGELEARVSPATAQAERGVLGQAAQATHFMYVAPTELGPNYRVEQVGLKTELASAAEAGATVVRVSDAGELRPGDLIELQDSGEAQQRVVVEVKAEELTIEPALAAALGAGSDVTQLRAYRVLTVEDEAGAGHHMRALLEELPE